VSAPLRQAADLDYHFAVLSDGCRDPVPEIDDLLAEKVFPR
jgi:hypothetical protein